MTVVNLYTLAASAVASSIWASKPIRWYSNLPSSSSSSSVDASTTSTAPTNANARVKNDGTLVTDADGAAQRVIVDMLRRVSPEIRIVGEESREDSAYSSAAWDNESDIQSEMIEQMNEEISQRITQPREAHRCMDPSRISVFIDPLDGTKSYTNGKYESVTTLIAIVVDNTPCFGVLCKPFGQIGHETTTLLHNTGCFAVYGGTLLQGAFIAGGGDCRGPLRNPDPNPPQPRLVISKSRAGGVVRKILHKMSNNGLLHNEPLHISGAGEKTLRLVMKQDNAQLWFFPKPGTSLWDVAVADALLMALGGKVTDKNGDRIDYSRGRTDAGNDNGIVACTDVELHMHCLKAYEDERGNEDDETDVND